jgi:hypothetical protein
MPSGAPPVLAEDTYWRNTRQVAEIRQSIATYDPLAVIARRHAGARAAHRVRARKALDRRAQGLLDAERIEQLAVQAAERQLAELADPPGLYYLTLEEWVTSGCFPYIAAPFSGTTASGPGPLPAPEFVARKRRWTSGSSILAGNDGNADTPTRRHASRPGLCVSSALDEGGAAELLPSMRPLMSDSSATLAAGGSRRYPLRFTRSPFMSLASVPVLIFFLAFQRHFAKGLTGDATK